MHGTFLQKCYGNFAFTPCRYWLLLSRSLFCKKNLSKSCRSWLHASFDTFWVQIDRLVWEKSIFIDLTKYRKWSILLKKWSKWLLNRTFNQFGLKRCQKKREEVKYKILWGFLWKLSDFRAKFGFENSVRTVLWSELSTKWTWFLSWEA